MSSCHITHTHTRWQEDVPGHARDMVVLGHGGGTMTQHVPSCGRDETLPVEGATETVVLRKCVPK